MIDDNIRERAIAFARGMPMSPDMVQVMAPGTHVGGWEFSPTTEGGTVDVFIIEAVDMTQLRIGLDNMIASALEVGYAMGVEDSQPKVRALVDKQRSAAARRAPKSKRK